MIIILMNEVYRDDLKADDNGVWERKGSPVTYVSIHEKKTERKKYLGDRN